MTAVASAMNDPQRLLAHGGGAHRRPVAPLVELIRDRRRGGAKGPTSLKLGPTGVVRRGELTYMHHRHRKAAARAHGNDSILFLRPKIFTEHGMRPSWHGHRERATGCLGGTAHADGSDGSAMDSTRRGGEHGQRRPWPGGTMLRQWQRALSWARDDLARWAASWAAQKQREGEWNGGAGRAGLGV
jgi:hypothetical protein